MTKQSNLLGVTPQDREGMLQALGLKTTDDLFQHIPEKIRSDATLDLPTAASEWELRREMTALASRNLNCLEADCYLGGGTYDHHVPAAIDAIANRGEFLTAYTPYQPEMSQGLLAALNDFTTKIAALVGLPVVTSSHYDGATALAEACFMAVRSTGKGTIAVSGNLLPHYRTILDTYSWGRSIDLLSLDGNVASGQTEAALSLDKMADIAAIVVQSPNQFGVLEDYATFSMLADDAGALLIGVTHPFLTQSGETLGDLGFDIVVLEGQPLGLHMFAGGAHLGILACTDALRALTPGRLIGRVSDINGKPALALVFEDREQHVARDRATSNICSNQALNAIRSGAFVSLYGADGLGELAELCARKAQALMQAIKTIPGLQLPYDGDVFNEFVVSFPTNKALKQCTAELLDKQIFAGLTSEEHTGLSDRQLLISVTETKSDGQLAGFVTALCGSLDCKADEALEALRIGLWQEPELTTLAQPKPVHPDLEAMTEPALVRKYTNYTRQNFGVDTGSYPLGSCTMKYNPKRNDLLTEVAGFQALHPMQPVKTLSGLVDFYGQLQQQIATLIGMDAVDLTPAAGAHGELKGLLVARRYFEDLGQHDRVEVLIPDSAHGTNPASASMVGFKCKIIETRPDGLMDVVSLKRAISDKTAVLMTTNPSTFGLFEEEIEEIIKTVHDAGALLYYDGANMNALMGYTTPGAMGFDIAHVNVHKTLSTPHGGGGPGAGPIGVKSFLEPYISKGFIDDKFESGPLSSKLYFGHISVLLRAFAFMRSLGPDGLRQATTDAVLNANYLMHRLRPVLPPVFDKVCMHEVLLNGADMPISTLDLSKRMIDFEIHPPTLVGAGCVYYGEDLSAAMLFEPTESESKAELDQIADTVIDILSEASEDITIAQSAPHQSPVSRLILK